MGTPAMLSLPQLQALSTVPQLLMPPLLFQLPMPLPQPTPMVSTTFTTLANVRPKLIHNTYTMPIPMLDTHIPVFTTMFITPLESTVHPFTTPLVFTAEMSTTTFMEDGIKRMNVSPQKEAMAVSRDTIGMKNK